MHMGNRWVAAVDRMLWGIDIDGWLQTSRTAKPNFQSVWRSCRRKISEFAVPIAIPALVGLKC